MDQSRLTSLSLVDGLRAQDDECWHRLDTLYRPIVDYWIQSAGVDRESIQDVRQDVLIAVSKNISQYKHSEEKTGTLRSWIWGIARNKIADFRRKEARRQVAAGGTAALGLLQDLPADPFEDSDPDTAVRLQKELVARALGILESDFQTSTWKAFWMTVVDERPTREVAETLQVTTKAVRQARYRVLRRLRAELGDELPDS